MFAAIDAGTRGVTCTLFDERGNEHGASWQAWHVDEADLGALEPSIAAGAVAGACEAARDVDVAAVGVTSQRTGVVFLAEDGTPLLISPNRDGRGAMHGVDLEREHGEAIWRINGRLPAMLYLPARLRAVRAAHPEWIVHSVLSLSDWIVRLLTGTAATEPTQAAEMGVFDLASGTWSDELLASLDVPRALLPPIAPTGTVAGEVTDLRWGIGLGTPVVAAGADTQCAALGMGALATGDAVVVAGTTMLTGSVRDDPSPDPGGRLWTSPMPVPGRWLREAHCGEAGALVDWAAALMGTDAAAIARESDDGQPGAGGVQVVDPFPSAARDFVLLKRASLLFPAPVLALGRPRADVARAVFEGVAFGARAGLDWLAEAHGEPARVLVAGGVSRSEAFRAALAGASERDITVARGTQTSGLGAAIVAAAAHHGDLDAAVEAMADPGEAVPAHRAHGYPAHYAAWREQAQRVHDEAARTGGMA
jgi:autoinducer 2 (AI-2) kinase